MSFEATQHFVLLSFHIVAVYNPGSNVRRILIKFPDQHVDLHDFGKSFAIEDGKLLPDNNGAERAIRPIALWRNNSYLPAMNMAPKEALFFSLWRPANSII